MTSSPICNYMTPSPRGTRADISSEHILGKRRNQAFLRLQVSVKRGSCLWLWSLEFLVQVLCGILDPLLFGVSTDLFAQLGLEAVEENKQLGYPRKSSFLNPQDNLLWGKSHSGIKVLSEEGWDSRLGSCS